MIYIDINTIEYLKLENGLNVLNVGLSDGTFCFQFRGGHGRVPNTILPQANFVNYCSF